MTIEPNEVRDALAATAPVTTDSPTFAELGVRAETVAALEAAGIVRAFAIQEYAVPIGMRGADLIGQAPTGTGKTLGFGIPLLERVLSPADGATGRPQALVVVPTRELGLQVARDIAAAGLTRGVHGQLHRLAGGDQAVPHTERGGAVRHGQFAFQHDVADPPAPAGQAVDQVEAFEVVVAVRVDRAAGPFVYAQFDPVPARQSHDRVERHEPDHPGRGGGSGDHLEGVVPAGAQAADGAHGVPAEPVRDDPLPGGAGTQITADLRPERDSHPTPGPASSASIEDKPTLLDRRETAR
jgi:hypothetical protein